MNWKSEIKPFASLEINGKTVLAFREKGVRKKTAEKVFGMFLETYNPKSSGKSYDWLIISNTGITACRKETEPPCQAVLFKDLELKLPFEVSSGGAHTSAITFNYRENFYE